MKTSYPQWQGHFPGSDAVQATGIQRFFKSLSGLMLTFLAAYLSVVILHWSDADKTDVDQSDFVMTTEAISEEC